MSKNVPAGHAREDLLQISLAAGDDGSIGKRDPNRGNPRSRLRRLGVGGPEAEEVAPLPRVLRPPDLPRGPIHDGELPVPEQAPAGNVGAVQLLSHHRLHRIAPQRYHRTSLDLPRQGRRRIGLHGVLLRPARSSGSRLTRGKSGGNARQAAYRIARALQTRSAGTSPEPPHQAGLARRPAAALTPGRYARALPGSPGAG